MFVYCVMCERADGRQMFVFDTRNAALLMCKALTEEGADPWILEKAVYTEQFVGYYTREA